MRRIPAAIALTVTIITILSFLLLIVGKFPIPPGGQRPLGEPTLGPETEASFDRVIEGPQEVRPETETMEESPLVPCDLDKDGDCDEADKQIFDEAFGKCRGELGYNFDADIDGDGCVVTNDEQIFSTRKFVNEAP